MAEIPTLGGIVGNWIQEHVAIPGGDRQGEPFLLVGEQWDFVLRFYALDPQGRFMYRRGGHGSAAEGREVAICRRDHRRRGSGADSV